MPLGNRYLSVRSGLLWLIGATAERRAHLWRFLARLLVTWEDYRTTIAELVDVIGPPDQWVASEHDTLLAG